MNEKNDKEIIEVKEVEAERINNNEAALANHDFYPLLIVYGGVLLGTLCFRIAMKSTFKR
ncbi:MAG: hypothetical protein EBV81_05670 [Proteobacteria bacterium]|nr:hypothetical protein [Candidatus Fonsibacter sp. PEL5]